MSARCAPDQPGRGRICNNQDCSAARCLPMAHLHAATEMNGCGRKGKEAPVPLPPSCRECQPGALTAPSPQKTALGVFRIIGSCGGSESGGACSPFLGADGDVSPGAPHGQPRLGANQLAT